MTVNILSFGFKHGVPKNCDLVFDARFLNNPHFVPELREHTGLDKDVQDFIKKDERYDEFLKKTFIYLKELIPHYAHEGKSYLTIGVGCTGGHHRSVFFATELARMLTKTLEDKYAVTVTHNNLSE